MDNELMDSSIGRRDVLKKAAAGAAVAWTAPMIVSSRNVIEIAVVVAINVSSCRRRPTPPTWPLGPASACGRHLTRHADR